MIEEPKMTIFCVGWAIGVALISTPLSTEDVEF